MDLLITAEKILSASQNYSHFKKWNKNSLRSYVKKSQIYANFKHTVQTNYDQATFYVKTFRNWHLYLNFP